MNGMVKRLVVIGSTAAVLSFGLGVPATAEEPAIERSFPDNLVCSFPLTVKVYGEGSQVYKEFTDKDGNLRILSAGTGYDVIYTNENTGASFSSASNGAVVDKTTVHADGSQTKDLTEHNVVFMFPTDVPAGPSTTLYTGQVVINVDPDDNLTIVTESGKKLDICAVLTR